MRRNHSRTLSRKSVGVENPHFAGISEQGDAGVERIALGDNACRIFPLLTQRVCHIAGK
jgi:hypothetical protein